MMRYPDISPLVLGIFLAGCPTLISAQMRTSPAFLASSTALLSSSSDATGAEAFPVAATSTGPSAAKAHIASVRPFSTVGIAVSVGTFGIGGQVATPLSRKTALRAEGNLFSYNSATYSNDGINYSGALKLRSAEALLDWFPFGGAFRLSPGVQLYNGLNVAATLAAPAGQSFTLNSVRYYSSAISPVTGTASLTTHAVAPMFTLGFGSLVPRHGHITVPFDLGFVYQGAPKVAIALAGVACTSEGANCANAATDPTIQSNLAAQQTIVSNDVAKYFRFYPVLSIGLGYKF